MSVNIILLLTFILGGGCIGINFYIYYLNEELIFKL